MSGTPFDPVAMEARLDAKFDRIFAQLSAINKRLDSHDERLARLEELQQPKKVRAAATPTTGTVAFNCPLIPVKALKGNMAIDTAGQATMNDNMVTTPVGSAVQRYMPPHRRARARTSSPSPPRSLAA